MNYLKEIIFNTISILTALFITQLLPSYFSTKGKNLATKEDIADITKEIEEVKLLYKKREDLSAAERGFYDDMVRTIEDFLNELKKYELENK